MGKRNDALTVKQKVRLLGWAPHDAHVTGSLKRREATTTGEKLSGILNLAMHSTVRYVLVQRVRDRRTFSVDLRHVMVHVTYSGRHQIHTSVMEPGAWREYFNYDVEIARCHTLAAIS